MEFASLTPQRSNRKVEELSPFRYLIALQDNLIEVWDGFYARLKSLFESKII